MDSLIAFLLSNFTLTFLVLGFVASAIAIARTAKLTFAGAGEELLAYFILCSIALSFFYNFVMHVFFGAMAASFIGWADSPFQAEVGYASLGFAAVGLIAFKGGNEVRLASILGPALFQWGAAAGHIRQIVTAANFAPGNAGIMLYSDIFLPLIGFGLLWLKWRAGKAPAEAPVAARAIRS